MKISKANDGKIWARPTTESETEIFNRLPVQKIDVAGKKAAVFTKESDFQSFMRHFEIVAVDVYNLPSVQAACAKLTGRGALLLKAKAQRWSTADRSQLTQAGLDRIDWLKNGVMANTLEKWADDEAKVAGYGS